MRIVLAAAALLFAAQASACGYCVEDKVASTYDHAAVTRALAQKHHVAFFHIDGAVSPALREALEKAVYSVAGVDPGSARIAIDTLTLSLSFDPRRVSLGALTANIDRRLARQRLSLMPLRIMEHPADLKTVKR